MGVNSKVKKVYIPDHHRDWWSDVAKNGIKRIVYILYILSINP